MVYDEQIKKKLSLILDVINDTYYKSQNKITPRLKSSVEDWLSEFYAQKKIIKKIINKKNKVIHS